MITPPELDEHGLPVHEALRESFVRWLMRDEVPAAPGKARESSRFVPHEDPVERAYRAAYAGAYLVGQLASDSMTPTERRRFRDAAKQPEFSDVATRVHVEARLRRALDAFEAQAA